MFLKVKRYESSTEPTYGHGYRYIFTEYVIINTSEITSINESSIGKAVNDNLDGVPGKKLFEIHLHSQFFLVDSEYANRIFSIIGASL